jgi:bacterial/archaeal transporter family protein
MNWLGLALLSAVFAGLVGVFGKLGMRDVDSIVATTIRCVVMLLVLLLVVFLQGRQINLSKVNASDWIFVALAGIAGAASWVCYFQALKIGQASRVAPIDRLSIVVTIVLAALFLGEKLTLKIVAGALLVVLGAVIIAI